LFHCVQRVTHTLKKKHDDHFFAIQALCKSIYKYNEEDNEQLLTVLKNGSTSTTYLDDNIADLRASKQFKQRHDRHLRKEIRPPLVMQQLLGDWFDRFKCSTSVVTHPARSRLDPLAGDTLFTSETKEAVLNCKEKACHLQDPLPLDQMYQEMPPGPNSSEKRQIITGILPSMLAHFGNCGMKTMSADNLNLTGTARHNLAMRHTIIMVDR